MRLCEGGNDTNQFDIMTSLHYGSSKPHFNSNELSDYLILYASVYFPQEYEEDPRVIIEVILELAVKPFVKSLFSDSTSNKCS